MPAAIALPGLTQSRVLNVYNWSDYIEPSVLEAFTKETGIKVRYDTFDSNDTLETKLLAGKSGYDVVVPTAYFLERQIKAGLFQKLDKSKLTNIGNVWPEIAKRLSTYDPGNAHAVNYMWGTTGIGYNVKKAQAILGPDAKLPDAMAAWDIVLKPENLARFKDCGSPHAGFRRRHPVRGAQLSRSRSEFESAGRSGKGRCAADDGAAAAYASFIHRST